MTHDTLDRRQKLMTLTCVGTACVSFLSRVGRSSATTLGAAAIAGAVSLSAGHSAHASFLGDLAKGIDNVADIAKNMDRGSKGFQRVLDSANSDSVTDGLANASKGFKKMDRAQRRSLRAAKRLGIGG